MVPGLELALLIVLVVANPTRLDRESTELRLVSIGLVVVLAAANGVTLARLIQQLVSSDASISGRTLLSAAVGVWTTNVLAYAIWYWEIDRGGPIRRCRSDHPRPDFLFTQMENPGVHQGPWSPTFVDYLSLSITNSTAFSPTDTLPLTTRAKALMGAQALCSLATIVVVGARAVNILAGDQASPGVAGGQLSKLAITCLMRV